MKAKEGVINVLNKVLTADLTAINQYLCIPRCMRIGAVSSCMNTSAISLKRKSVILPA